MLPLTTLVAFCVALPLYVMAQTQQYPTDPATKKTVDVVELQSSSRKEIKVPSFSNTGAILCDSDHNAYFFVRSEVAKYGIVLSIAKSGEVKNTFPLGPSLQDEPGIVLHFVTPSGSVYLLDQLPLKGVYLLSYNRDGHLSHSTSLAIPEHVEVERFAASDDGNAVLVGGHYDDGAAPPQKDAPFLAVFDSSGKNFRTVEGVASQDLLKTQSNYTQQAISTGDDGMFYVLTLNHVFVIDQAGRKVREIAVQKPAMEAFVQSITVSGNKMLISFYTEGRVNKQRPDLALQLVDLANGKISQTYASSAIGNSLACFDYKEGFTFVTMDHGKSYFTQAPIN